MRNLLWIVLVLIGVQAKGQTIAEMEYDLNLNHPNYGEKIKTAKKILSQDPLNYAALSYAHDFYKKQKIDSTEVLFDALIRQYPERVEPLILKAEISQSNVLETLLYYLKAENIEPQNSKVLNRIAAIYYRDFIRPTEKDDFENSFVSREDSLYLRIAGIPLRESVIPKSGKKALEYFYKVWAIDSTSHDVLYYPIRQLEHYLNIRSKNYTLPKLPESFFPAGHFMDLSENWERNLSVNYLTKAESSKMITGWYEKQLQGLEEQPLLNQKNKTEIYRFTYLPSFDHPVVIRLERTDNNYKLFWKVGEGAGGYEPIGIKKAKHKKISENEWRTFLRLLTHSDYQNFPNEKYVLMTDGQQWIIEYKSQDNYFAKSTNYPSPEFKNACRYLLNIAGVKIRE